MILAVVILIFGISLALTWHNHRMKKIERELELERIQRRLKQKQQKAMSDENADQ